MYEKRLERGVMRVFFKIFFLGIFSLICGFSYAYQEIEVTADDRVLIVAPHPDDEAIACAGIIQKCVRVKAQVTIAYMTNGDYNEVSYLFYKKHPVLTPKGFQAIGITRKREARSAMKFLKISPQDAIFLGYPDRFLEPILLRFWDARTPCRSMLTRMSKVPYRDAPGFGEPYIGTSILRDMRTIIRNVKPTKIFVSSPHDTNGDHRGAYVFTLLALLECGYTPDTIPVYTFLVHRYWWPKPKGYYPACSLDAPKALAHTSAHWLPVALDRQEVAKKFQCVSFYKSQLSFDRAYLMSFVRTNELFSTYAPARIEHKKYTYPIRIKSKLIAVFECWQEDGFLCMRVTLQKRIARRMRAGIFLLPYSPNIHFSRMPKIAIKAHHRAVRAYDKGRACSLRGAQLIAQGNTFFFKVPLRELKNPAYVFGRIVLKGRIFTWYNAPWRLLVL